MSLSKDARLDFQECVECLSGAPVLAFYLLRHLEKSQPLPLFSLSMTRARQSAVQPTCAVHIPFDALSFVSRHSINGTQNRGGGGGRGGGVAQSVERATPGEEVPGSIPAVAARSLLVGSVSV